MWPGYDARRRRTLENGINRLTYANIVVDAVPGPSVRRKLEAARDISAAFGSTLDVVSCAWPNTSLMAEALGGSIAASQWQTSSMQEALETTRGLYEEVMQGSLVESRWCSSVAEPVRALRDHLFTADLAITSSDEPGPFCTADPTELARGSGAPVLRLSRDPGDVRFEHVLIAWKDGSQARRAVHEALPFLQRARSVCIAGVGDEAPADRLDLLSRHLSRHHVAARPVHLSRSGDGVGAQLLSQARSEGCSLVVSGAYSHNRNWERILGGVTRDLEADDGMSWFFAH